MMVSRPEPNEDQPLDDLSPRLRKAVDAVLRDAPPEELTRRCLDAARRQRPLRAGRPARRLVYLAALAVAACVAGVLLVWHLRRGDRGGEIAVPPAPIEKPAAPEEPARQPPSQPTWWAYHQAARQSPEALEALLDKHADQLALSGPTSWRFGVPVEPQSETL